MASDDVYLGGDSASATIASTSGGNFENLVVDPTAAATTITDDTDITTISLSATPSVTEGGTITYTATLTNPAGTDVTVNLSNGQTITITAGTSQGTASVTASDDVYQGGDSTSATINSATGGNFESLVVDPTPAATTITDDSDVTTVSLTATPSVTEGGTITYTATLTNPAGTDVTVNLSNGQTITIIAGTSQGTVNVAASDDVYLGGSSTSATIASTSGGNFESLVVDPTPAATTITDDTDLTTLSLSATPSVTEGGTITYTATLTNPAGTDVTVNLSNGQTITITAGTSQGTVNVTASDDVYLGGDSASATISSATGGNFESLAVDPTPAATTITDDADATTVSLNATPSVTEGGTITYTATLTNPAGTDVTVNLSNGQTITIAAGTSQGTVHITASDDVYLGGDSASATINSATGGNFENLVVDSTPATTTITDNSDTTTVSLSATPSVTEGGTITYTATLTNPAGTDVTVNLSNGQSITITAGTSQGTVNVTASDDVYLGGSSASASIASTSGGNFENLVIDPTPAATTITDDTDITTISLSATPSMTEGGTITYTATLTNPAGTDVTVNLSNGQTITIAAGTSQGTVNATASDDVYLGGDSASATISSATGGNFESLVVDPTPATTIITDDADLTTVALTATPSVTEGGTITYTATLSNPADTATTITLSNGAVISIAAGLSSGTTDVVASDDVYVGGNSASATIASASGGNFESLVIDPTPAATTITDDSDVTTISLSATPSVTEGGTITYTATLTNPAGTDVTVNLSNGQTITIAAGTSQGTVDITASDDVYLGGDSASATIASTTGGNFESLIVDPTAATTTITDDTDVTTVSLSATPSVTEGGTITYTATLTNPAGTDVTINLSNGQTITIIAGTSQGSVNITASDDVYLGGDSASATISSTTGGNFESLLIDPTPAATTITDDTDITTISLSATPSVTEGGTITYTATLTNPAGTDVIVYLNNGLEEIFIAAGTSSGSASVPVSDDVYLGGDSVSATITSAIGGNFENLVIDPTPATTTITDDADITTISLSTTPSVVEGGTITYTASLTNPASTDVTVNLSNGQTITITAGSSQGTVDVTASDDVYQGGDSASATISSASGGNFENLVVDSSPANTTITDDADATTLSLSATTSVNEGGTITYTASLTNPAQGNVTVTLDNGAIITITSGQSTGTVNVAAGGGSSASVLISNATGGNFENLQLSTTPAVTTINDLPPVITVTAVDVTEESVSAGDVIATFTSSDPGGDALTHQILNDPNGYFTLAGNDVVLTQQGVDAINNDSSNLNSLDITVQVTADGQTAVSTDTSNITRVNDAPVTSTDTYAAAEGGSLIINAASGVLTNDSDPEGTAITASQFATDISGTNQVAADGSNSITTALGGTITLNADGSFSYTAPATLDHSSSDTLQDSFAYRASDSGAESPWTEVTINIADTEPVAADDIDSVAFGDSVSGNVISGQGGDGTGADTLGQDTAELTAVIFNGVTYSGFNASGNLSINADYGTLTINKDGSYTYDSNQTLTPVGVGGGNLSTWSAVNLYGFNAGTSFVSGSQLNLAAADGNANIVYRSGFGLGLDSPGNSDSSSQIDQRNGDSEAIAIDLTTSALSATVDLASVGGNDDGQWLAYDSSFNLVASDTFDGNTGSVTINPGTSFQYLVFTALENNDDYNVTGISYIPDISLQESFSYVLEDSDGDQSIADLTIEHDALPEAIADVATAYESVLSYGSQEGGHSVISTGNLLDNDKGISSSTTITEISFVGSTYTANAQGIITVDSPQGILVVYTQDDLANNIRAGDYEYTLETHKLLGDNVSETFTYTLDNGTTVSSNDLTVNIVDDRPTGGDIETSIVASPPTDTYNLVIVLDSSGSMDRDVNGNSSGNAAFDPNQVRMDIAKAALAQLFDAYDAAGNVNIQIVDFNDNVTESVWYNDNVNSATDYLNSISAGGGTRYSTALNEVSTGFTPPAADKTLVYFISDGDPNSGYEVDATGQANWENFLDNNNVDISFGIGIGNVSVNSLEPIAYPNEDSNNNGVDDFAIQVNNANELADTLLSTLDNGIVSGSISVLNAGGQGLFVGADGGFIDSITVDGTTYNYVPGVNENLDIVTALGGTLKVDFVTGEYTYQVDLETTNLGAQEVFAITVTDNDGDSKSANIIINLEYEPNLDANRDIVLTNVPDGSAITIPAIALMHNDTTRGTGVLNSVSNANNGNVTGLDPVEFTLVPSANALTGNDFSATATAINETAGDSETTPVNNSIATAVDFSDRSLFGADGSALPGLSRSGGFHAAYYGSIASDANAANGSDQDWLQIQLAQGENIWFDIDGASLPIEMAVYDRNGNFIQNIANNGQPWGDFTAPDEGTYYVAIETADVGISNYELYMTIDTTNAIYNDSGSFEYTLEKDGFTDSTTVDVQAAVAGTTITGSDKDEVLIGDNSDDTLQGNAGDDALVGGQGSDTLEGGEGDDLLLGGQGNDNLTGGLGSDIFAWELADKGSAGSPAVDTVTDFDTSNDLLDLRDLLVDEEGTDLTEFLYLETSGSDTIIHISTEGGFEDGVYDSSKESQTIQLNNVDLVTGFGGDQAAMIQDLINKNNLLTD